MAGVSSRYKAMFNSRTPEEFFENTPAEFTEILAAIPAFSMIISSLLRLIYIILFNNDLSVSFYFSRTVCLMSAVFLLIVCIKKRYINKSSFKCACRENIPAVFFAVFVVLMIVSTIVNGFTEKALFGDPYRRESLFSYIIYFAVYYFCSSLIKNQDIKRTFIYFFLSASLLLNITGVIRWLYAGNTLGQTVHNLTGIFDNANHFGYYLVFVVILGSVMTVTEKNIKLKLLAFVSFLIGTVTLVLNNTFGCFIACIAAQVLVLIAVSVVNKKFSLFSVVMIVVFWGITIVSEMFCPSFLSDIVALGGDISDISSGSAEANMAGTGRWLLWKTTFGYIIERPILGSGVEGIADGLLEVSGADRINRTHNEYLQYAAFFGIPALIAYLGGVMSVFLSALKKRARLDIYSLAAMCAAFAYLVSALFGNTMHYTAPYFFIFLGLSFGIDENKFSRQDKTDADE